MTDTVKGQGHGFMSEVKFSYKWCMTYLRQYWFDCDTTSKVKVLDLCRRSSFLTSGV